MIPRDVILLLQRVKTDGYFNELIVFLITNNPNIASDINYHGSLIWRVSGKGKAMARRASAGVCRIGGVISLDRMLVQDRRQIAAGVSEVKR